MTNYALMYRLGITPWERYAQVAEGGIDHQLARAEAGRVAPFGRALDLGCGRGASTRLLARRGWDVTGVDVVPDAIRSARRRAIAGARFVVGDVTDLRPDDLGRFDLFLDIGCFQGLDERQRAAEGRGVTALANDGGVLVLLAFGRTRWRPLVGGVASVDVEAAFPGWELRSVEPATTHGLGWPMNRTRPQWYRLVRRGPGGDREQYAPRRSGATPDAS